MNVSNRNVLDMDTSFHYCLSFTIRREDEMHVQKQNINKPTTGKHYAINFSKELAISYLSRAARSRLRFLAEDYMKTLKYNGPGAALRKSSASIKLENGSLCCKILSIVIVNV